jgi:hypothetical protein
MIAISSFRPLRGFLSALRAEFPALTDGAITCRPFGTQVNRFPYSAIRFSNQGD